MYVCQTANLGVDFVGHKVNASSSLGDAYRLLSEVAILSYITTSYVGNTYLSPMFYNHGISVGSIIIIQC